MAPKKDATTPETAITGFNNKETRILAAAFVSSIGVDKYDYPLFANLSGFKEGTLKKFWPPIKKKVMAEHHAFGAFLTGTATAAPKTALKKRKAGDAKDEAEAESSVADKGNKAAKRSKHVKTEEVDDEDEDSWV